jgi:hypothetical protein
MADPTKVVEADRAETSVQYLEGRIRKLIFMTKKVSNETVIDLYLKKEKRKEKRKRKIERNIHTPLRSTPSGPRDSGRGDREALAEFLVGLPEPPRGPKNCCIFSLRSSSRPSFLVSSSVSMRPASANSSGSIWRRIFAISSIMQTEWAKGLVPGP